ncbi:MAG: aminodeoxychorismate synthase component I [Chloroflexi bacterium]|nr:aminodeoxychorismate synthase component I [Chloroflexota bacterium]
MDPTYPVVLRDSTSGMWLHFEHPRRIISAAKLDEVLPALRELEAAVDQNGWFAAGFISYEAAPAFDSALTVHKLDNFPLLWFGLYDDPIRSETLGPRDEDYQLGEWLPSVNREKYNAAIAQVKNQIAHGNTYQVNYTFRLRNNFSGSSWSLFVDMVNAQAPGYSAYLDTGPYVICSASPELFFRLDANTITCRPMKGTVKRGRTLAEDHEKAVWLQNSPKNRAENVMIVDMIRNDLGRLAEIGSVHVPELFVAERYPTLWQMTSGVTAEIRAPFTEIIKNLFPCASITGAPKVSTMKIIAALETTPRRVYTGSIGYLGPGRKAQFSVAIRSVLIERSTGKAEYGIGGGIVWDSTSKDEYAEALLKARVLTGRPPEFSLLETIRWTTQTGYFLLDKHLDRLADSASYFGFPYNRSALMETLAETARGFGNQAQRVRLLLNRQGSFSHQVYPLSSEHQELPMRVKLAAAPVNSADVFLYHKTTWRTVYEKARQSQSDCDEVLLFNERDELTEASIANLVFELDGDLVTPPVTCGLLAGTLRGDLIKQGRISEKIVTLGDLARCTQIFLINSVRGWQKAELIENTSTSV